MSNLSLLIRIEASNILNQYSGFMGAIWNIGYTRGFVQEVGELVDEIRRGITVVHLSMRLTALERYPIENDALKWYIQRVRDSIASLLRDMPDYLFPKHDVYHVNHYEYMSSENSIAFLNAFDMLLTEKEKTLAFSRILTLPNGLYRLMKDAPNRTIPLIWIRYQDNPNIAIAYLLSTATTSSAVKELLNLLKMLPDTRIKPWITMVTPESQQTLLNLTIDFVPERSNEIIAYMESMLDDTEKEHILSLCLNRQLKASNGYWSYRYPSDFSYGKKVFDVIKTLSDKNLVYRMLIQPIPGIKYNLIESIGHRTLFELLHLVKDFEDEEKRNHLMQIIFENAVRSHKESRVLIDFLLSTPNLPAAFLQLTSIDSNLNILHLAAARCADKVSTLLDKIVEVLPSQKEAMLAACTKDNYTPLMVATLGAGSAVPYLLDAIISVPGGPAILRQIGTDGFSALTLSSPANAQLIVMAIGEKYKDEGGSSHSPSFFPGRSRLSISYDLFGPSESDEEANSDDAGIQFS